MKTFKDFWIKSHDVPIQEKLDEVKTDVHDLDEKLDQYETAGGTKKSMFDGFTKPGPSIHSSKWDDCVKNVSVSNPSANAYAVCTAQLGEESFKSEHRDLAYVKSEISKAKKEMNKVGISIAGPVPNSLLAEQDLEGKTKSTILSTTAKQLDKIADKADEMTEDSQHTEEQVLLADKIESLQQKRQKAMLSERKKSFKQNWKDVNKKMSSFDAEKRAYEMAENGTNPSAIKTFLQNQDLKSDLITIIMIKVKKIISNE